MKKILAGTVVLFVLCFWAWEKITSPYGDQRVGYLAASKECFSEESFKYCVYQAKQGTNGAVAYHLHGKSLDENSWNDDTYYTSMLQKSWAEKLVKPPTIVSVSFGPIWLLVPKNSSPQSGLLEKFVNEIIPKVESRLGKPQHRYIFGESMGGLNSLIVGLKTNGIFSKVAALCPVIYSSRPSVRLSEINKILERTGADPKTVFGAIALSKKYVSNDSEWDDISPLELVKKITQQKNPKFYLSCGLYDKYGNFEGTELLAKAMEASGVQVDWHPLYGGHCAIDVVSLANFLAE